MEPEKTWSYPRIVLEVLATHILHQETEELKARFGASTSTKEPPRSIDSFLWDELDTAKARGLPIEDI